MTRHKAAGRYARAAFDMALEQGKLEQLREDLHELEWVIRESLDFAGFIGNYLIPAERRVKALRALIEGRVSPIAMKFLLFLESKKRLGLLAEICHTFEELYDAHEGILKVTITSTRPLSETQLEEIEHKLERKYEKKIKTGIHIDPSLIGGFRIHVGDRIEDYSLFTQLAVLKQNLIHG